MERQAKDGTFYKQVGPDDWTPVTRQAKDGTVYRKVGPEDWTPMAAPPSAAGPDGGDKARAAVEGFAESASLGTIPYLKAGAEMATDYAAEKLMGAPEDNTPFSERVDRLRKQGKDLQAKAPGYALGGQLAGFVVPGMGAAKLVTKGAQAAAKVPGLARVARAVENSGTASKLFKAAREAKAAGNLKRAEILTKAAKADMKAQALRLAGEGAILGGAYTPESGFTDLGARAEGATLAAGTGAVMPQAMRGAGAVVRGTGKAIKGTAKLASTASKRALGILGRVDDEVIDRYLANPERIRSAKTYDELYDEVTGVVRGMFDDLDNSKVDLNTAKAQLDEVARGIKESRVEGKASALEQVQRARASLDEAFKNKKQTITDKASPTRIEGQVVDALDNQKSRVSQGSKESFEILNKQNGVAIADDLAGAVDEVEKGLYIGSGTNKVLKNDSAEAGAKLLEKWRTKIFALSNEKGEIPFPILKQVLQGIDSDMKSAGTRGSSQFSEAAEQAMFDLRARLDSKLKVVKPYAEKMLTVADDARLLGESNKRFAGDSRLSRMANIGRPAAQNDLNALKQLAVREGGDLGRSVDEMVAAQRTLRSPLKMESVRAGLPENQAVRTAEAGLAVTKRMTKPQSIREAINQSAANQRAKSTKAIFEERKALANKFKSFSEQSAESKLKQVAAGKQNATRLLTELSELADKDFVEAVKAAKDAEAFTKTAFNGSRNVNLWSIFGIMGSSVGGYAYAGAGGAAVGAALGATMDVYGPRVTKKILDQIIKTKGIITPETIQAMDLPPNVKAGLIRQFQSTVLGVRAAANAASRDLPKAAEYKPPGELDQDTSTPAWDKKRSPDGTSTEPLKGKEKWASDGFAKLKQHGGPALDRAAMMSDPKTKDLLIRASDLKPGTKAMENLMKQIRARAAKEKG